LHVLLRGKLPPGRRRNDRIEMYGDGRFFTVTGQHLQGTRTTIEERTAELAAVHTRVFRPNESRHRAAAQPDELDDDRLLERARAAQNGEKFWALWNGDTSQHGGDDSAADLALCNFLAFWTACDAERIDRMFRQSRLYREKWDERRGVLTYGALT